MTVPGESADAAPKGNRKSSQADRARRSSLARSCSSGAVSPALAEASEAYRLFLTGLARGDAPDELGRLLDEADAQLQEILDEDRKDDNR
mgnify:CR=1 FL=1